MKFKKFNKATASAVSGAVVTAVGAVLVVEPEILGSIQTILTTMLVYLVANGDN